MLRIIPRERRTEYGGHRACREAERFMLRGRHSALSAWNIRAGQPRSQAASWCGCRWTRCTTTWGWRPCRGTDRAAPAVVGGKWPLRLLSLGSQVGPYGSGRTGALFINDLTSVTTHVLPRAALLAAQREVCDEMRWNCDPRCR